MPSVLLVGEDEHLQEIRAALLRTIGVKIVCCSAATAIHIQERQRCELVVLCYSLSEESKYALAKSIRTRWPATRVLSVTSARTSEQFGSDAGMDEVSSMNPQALIRRTEELLGQRKRCVSELGGPSKRSTSILG